MPINPTTLKALIDTQITNETVDFAITPAEVGGRIKDAIDYTTEQIATVSATPDASTTAKGKVKLAGDLAGTADLPTVPALALKEVSTNKSTDVVTDAASDIKYPSVKAVKTYVDANAGLNYKSCVALITHGAGNGNPTAQVLYNNIGAITWGYEEPNNYGASSSGLFTLNKTIVFVSSPQNPLMKVGALSNNANYIGLTTENDGFANLAIEIRVYN